MKSPKLTYQVALAVAHLLAPPHSEAEDTLAALLREACRWDDRRVDRAQGRALELLKTEE